MASADFDGSGSESSAPEEVEGMKELQRWLYDDPISGSQEPKVIKAEAYGDAAALFEDELTAVLDERRKKSLPGLLEVFNKIQGKTINADKLNLIRNDKVFTR